MEKLSESYVKEKVDKAYERFLSWSLVSYGHQVTSGEEPALREAFYAQLDMAELAESLDCSVELRIESDLSGRFAAACRKAAEEWEAPRVTAKVAFLDGQGREIGSADVDLTAYIVRYWSHYEAAEAAGEWDRYAEPLAEELIEDGFVEAPEGCWSGLCSRPEGLDEYVEATAPAVR